MLPHFGMNRGHCFEDEESQCIYFFILNCADSCGLMQINQHKKRRAVSARHPAGSFSLPSSVLAPFL